jgi:hypothetical protein
MEGYALRGEETFGASAYNPLTFSLVGESLPGKPFPRALQSGEAVRIMTGAPLPEGANALCEPNWLPKPTVWSASSNRFRRANVSADVVRTYARQAWCCVEEDDCVLRMLLCLRRWDSRQFWSSGFHRWPWW